METTVAELSKLHKSIQDEISVIESDCLTRIKQLQGQLVSIKKRVEDPEYPLSDLGELQAMAPILDCRLATLGTLRRVDCALTQKAETPEEPCDLKMSILEAKNKMLDLEADVTMWQDKLREQKGLASAP